MLDSLRFEPDRITVQRGEIVTFRLVNAGHLAHEFTIGGSAVLPGETAELTWAFSGPELPVFACHVIGHWKAGMTGTVASP